METQVRRTVVAGDIRHKRALFERNGIMLLG